MDFGEKIKELREAKGMTQQNLADLLFVTRQTVSRWEGGSRYPDLVTAKNLADILETTIDQVGPLSLESTSPCDINSTCVVFAQSEVISLVARKYDRRDILCGMHISMARRIIKMMKKSEKGGDILMTGGGALNIGLHRAFEEELMRDVYVASHPQFNGAIGAALIASERGPVR